MTISPTRIVACATVIEDILPLLPETMQSADFKTTATTTCNLADQLFISPKGEA